MCTPDVLQVPGLLRRAIARGAWVHTVSEFVAAEVVEAFDVDPSRVVAVPNGAPPLVAAGDTGLAPAGRAAAGADRYVLALGTLEPRKDLPTLVRAFDQVADDDPELVLVLAGPDGWGAEQVTAAIAEARHGRRIRRLGWVDDHTRMGLLVGAEVVAYTSVYEGFGLPPLEALACATPVVATRAGALPEVLGDAAEWADPGDPTSVATALRALLLDPARRADIVETGRGRLAAYSWDRTADDLVKLYQRAVEAR
jgi:glycosyltransferase involved in cell wall biosynthesis